MLAGTILTGVAVSTLVRPVFLLRYLYPVCVTSWLLFAVLLSRVPLRRAASLLVVMSLLLVQLPADRRTYQAEMEEEALCEYTLQQNQFDSDTVLLKIEQIGGAACHTGRRSCFYREWDNGVVRECSPVVFDPRKVYGTK